MHKEGKHERVNRKVGAFTLYVVDARWPFTILYSVSNDADHGATKMTRQAQTKPPLIEEVGAVKKKHSPKVYSKYSRNSVIRFLASKKCNSGQIAGVFSLLRIKVTPAIKSTINTVRSDVQGGRTKAFKPESEDAKTLLKLVPKEAK